MSNCVTSVVVRFNCEQTIADMLTVIVSRHFLWVFIVEQLVIHEFENALTHIGPITCNLLLCKQIGQSCVKSTCLLIIPTIIPIFKLDLICCYFKVKEYCIQITIQCILHTNFFVAGMLNDDER